MFRKNINKKELHIKAIITRIESDIKSDKIDGNNFQQSMNDASQVHEALCGLLQESLQVRNISTSASLVNLILITAVIIASLALRNNNMKANQLYLKEVYDLCQKLNSCKLLSNKTAQYYIDACLQIAEYNMARHPDSDIDIAIEHLEAVIRFIDRNLPHIKDKDTALSYEFDLSELVYLLAQCNFRTQDYSSAIINYERAIKLFQKRDYFDNLLEAYLHLAITNLKCEKFEAALDALSAFEKLFNEICIRDQSLAEIYNTKDPKEMHEKMKNYISACKLEESRHPCIYSLYADYLYYKASAIYLQAKKLEQQLSAEKSNEIDLFICNNKILASNLSNAAANVYSLLNNTESYELTKLLQAKILITIHHTPLLEKQIATSIQLLNSIEKVIREKGDNIHPAIVNLLNEWQINLNDDTTFVEQVRAQNRKNCGEKTYQKSTNTLFKPPTQNAAADIDLGCKIYIKK